MKFRARLDFSIEFNGRQLLTGYSRRRLEALVKRRAKMLCRYCGKYASDGHVDHIVPLARGGTDELTNLAWSCPKCNLSKGDKLLSEWDGPEYELEEVILQTEVEKEYDMLCALWDTQSLTRRNFEALFGVGAQRLYREYVSGGKQKLGKWEAIGAIARTGKRGSWEFCKSFDEIIQLDSELQDYVRNLTQQQMVDGN